MIGRTLNAWFLGLFFIFGIAMDANAGGSELYQLWETTGLSGPESVIYDPNSRALYVSNVNGSPVEQDGNGFIAKLSLRGEILALNWVSGLNAPKGLAIHNDKLYVADIDALVEIDIPSATISARYTAAGAKFLNDVTADDDGIIYVSDMMTNKIHRLKNEQFEVWLSSDELEAPNGLHAEPDRLVVGAWGNMVEGFSTETPGHMKAISYKDKTISSFGAGKPIGNLDGVEPVADEYYVTDWMVGKLYLINQHGEAELLLQLQQGMADIEYIANRSLILIPMMLNDKLLAYVAE